MIWSSLKSHDITLLMKACMSQGYFSADFTDHVTLIPQTFCLGFKMLKTSSGGFTGDWVYLKDMDHFYRQNVCLCDVLIVDDTPVHNWLNHPLNHPSILLCFLLYRVVAALEHYLVDTLLS